MRIRTRICPWAVLVLLPFLAACQSSTQNEPAADAGKAGARGGAVKSSARESRHLTIPAGTTVSVRLDQEIDTGKTEAGSSFSGTLAEPLTVEGVEVAPVGSAVAGKVTSAVSSGRLSRPAELSLVLTSLVLKGGDKVEITTHAWSEKGPSHKKGNIEKIGGGAAAGAVIGALTGGKKGAAIGAGIGAGAGTGVAAATGKKEIVLPPETKLSFRLSAAVTTPARS